MATPYTRTGFSYSANPVTRTNTNGSNLYYAPAAQSRQNKTAVTYRSEENNKIISENAKLGQSQNRYNLGDGTVGKPVFQDIKASANSVGNPQFLGGLSRIVLGDQAVNMPNALAQQIMFEESVNQGRANTAEKYFGVNVVDSPYYSYAVLQNQLNKMLQNNPRLGAENTPLNRYEADTKQSKQLNQDLMNAQNTLNQGTTEKRDISGNIIGGTNPAAQRALEAAKRAEAAFQPLNQRRGSYYEEMALNNYLAAQLRSLEGSKPTTANVAFTEKVL